MTSRLAPTVRLLHGADLPQVGLGTWPMKDAEAERVVADAITAGYRLIDTAQAYGNEGGVGRGLKASGIPREDLFITSKFGKAWHGRDLVKQAYEQSLDLFRVDYLDLFLIHWPAPRQNRYVEAWQGLVDLLEAGRLKAIGTSNFKPAHLERIIAETGVIPDVNQIQLSPALARTEPRAYHSAHGIVTGSYSPLGGDGAYVLNAPAVRAIAEQSGRTPAQVVLRWHIELGLVAVPKSSSAERLRSNLDIFDFDLTTEQVQMLSDLDRGEAAAKDSDLHI